jgi:dipeptidyl aminopeptidase/acylaminoacyl peptidase
MWMLSQTSIFKAISPGAGLSNIYSMYSETDIPHYLSWFFDNKQPWDNFNMYWDSSAMKYIKNAKTPAMIMHGQADYRVPIAQAYELYQGLLENGVPVEFVIYPREGHGIGEPRHHLDQMRRYLYFFGKYLNNPPVTEPKQ